MDDMIRRVWSDTCGWFGLVTNRSDFAGTALGEEAALEALAEGWHVTMESDAG
jgi:hypothetical protein